MDIQRYLERINYSGPLKPTTSVLFALQQQHLLTVPFENLDIHNKTRIVSANSFDKIVLRNRGGFCYELNYAFYTLLKQIGFTVKIISARVHMAGSFSPEYDHMALIVNSENKNYLVDVGFGEFSLQPLQLDTGSETNDSRGIFKIEVLDESRSVVKKKNESGEYIPEYSFSETERQLDEFTDRCNFHQTDPSSHFMQNKICSLATLTGRVSLSGNKFKITENGFISERLLDTETEYNRVLKDYFGINL